MNAEQRKQIEEGIEIAKGLTQGALDSMAGKEGEIVIRFAAPKGDGEGVKRWAGDIVEAVTSLGRFCAMLYTDGGHMIDVTMCIAGETRVVTREEWEASAGVLS